ncbi:MAG: PocR ligand-binding domain-containing protein [Kouleothrix sp.]|nr:PocR ligand-binding domain-containing protein [Kouleothrix sp.]
MSDLLTAHEVQDLLKIDRTTVYRMLKDGRLTGVKIGQQWRFPRDEVDALLAGAQPAEEPSAPPRDILPLHCVQPIQDVFSEVAGVSVVTTAPDGEPLTKPSNPCRFCALVQSSPSGRQACVASWRRLAEQSERRPVFAACHAGLQYARARIELDDELAAMLVAGQFYADPPDPAEAERRIERLAATHGLDPRELADAAHELPTLDQRMRGKISTWLESVAGTFETIGRERAELMGRLRRIAEMSTLG